MYQTLEEFDVNFCLTIVDYGSYGINSLNTPQSHSFTGLLHNT